MQPAPLRSKEFPDGSPGLTELNLLKVEKARALCCATAVIVKFVFCTVFWFQLRILDRVANLVDQALQQCIFTKPLLKSWTNF